MRTILACALLAVALSALAAEPSQPIPLDPAHWEVQGDAKFETFMGRPALRMCNAEVLAKDVQFLDGTLEFDLAVSTRRNFPMIGLRRQGEGEYEEFYFRTHKTELPDAIQYVPAWQGVGGWQLYHGPGFTAKATFPRNEWFPVRIVLSGTRAAVFVGDVAEPQLVVGRLRREPKAGGLEFADSCPKGSVPEGERVAAISNIVLRPGYVPYDFSKATTKENMPPSGVVAAWELSESFVAEKGAVRALPEEALRGKWQKVAAEPSGLVVFERYLKLSGKPERESVLARVSVDSPDARVRRFDFGYSDEVTVFLNGQPLFSGDAHYSHDNPRQEGLIGFWQGTLYLPLQKGRNEIILAVSEVFGGWGVMGRLEENPAPSPDARLASSGAPAEDGPRDLP
jgi:hypothetical protein